MSMSHAMPLSMARQGQVYSVESVHGDSEVRKHLGTLGFVPGGAVEVVNQAAGQVIVKVKQARMGLNEQTARKVFVS